MRHFYLVVKSQGGYLRKDEMEYRIVQREDGLRLLQTRFMNVDHSEELNEGWLIIFSCRDDI